MVTGKTAVLIIDAQVNMFDETMPVYNATKLLTNLNKLSRQAHEAGVPVIFFRYDGGPGAPDEYGTPGWQLHHQLESLESDIIVDKQEDDSFQDTPLQDHLTRRQIKNLVIAGVQTELCVRATTLRAVELGYDVTLAADAHSTFNTEEKSAAELIAEHNLSLGKFVTVKSTENITFQS